MEQTATTPAIMTINPECPALPHPGIEVENVDETHPQDLLPQACHLAGDVRRCHVLFYHFEAAGQKGISGIDGASLDAQLAKWMQLCCRLEGRWNAAGSFGVGLRAVLNGQPSALMTLGNACLSALDIRNLLDYLYCNPPSPAAFTGRSIPSRCAKLARSRL